jgi:CheY-like chemotaxis protein
MSYYAQTRDRILEFEISIYPAVPDFIHGDSLRLNQILNNLISNAIKFTKAGRVDCKVKLLNETKKKVELEFLISDTGIGIPREKQESIFNPFQQVSSKTTRKYGGTGLGLSITKELIEKQGGSLVVESELKKGSTFRVRLKFGKAKPEEIKKGEHKTQRFEPFKDNDFKILYVEDVSSNRYLMQAYCNQWNLNLVTCSGGEEAISMMRKQKFHLILMDLQMPDLDGFETVQLMQEEFAEMPPVVALSADVSQKVARKIDESGMRDYITKPVQIEVLYNKLREILLEKIVRRNQTIAEQTALDNQSIHRTLLGIYGNDVKEYQKYLSQVNEELIESRNEIISALEKRHLEKFREARHKLIGPIGIFNLHKLQEHLDNIRFEMEYDLEGMNLDEKIAGIEQIFEETTSGLQWNSIDVAETS